LARQGDEPVFRLLHRSVQPRLPRYLHAVVGVDAEDVASVGWPQVAHDLLGSPGLNPARRAPGRHPRPPV